MTISEYWKTEEGTEVKAQEPPSWTISYLQHDLPFTPFSKVSRQYIYVDLFLSSLLCSTYLSCLSSWQFHPVLMTVFCSMSWSQIGSDLQVFLHLLLCDLLCLQNGPVKGQTWWHMPVIPALGRWKKEDQEFKFILSYILNLRPV